MVDIVEVEAVLDAQVHHYKDTTLNDLSEFQGHNPSIERFAFVLCTTISKELKAPNIDAIKVKVWENDIAWASYSYHRHKEGYAHPTAE